MSFRRALQCVVITGLMTVALPCTAALADNGNRDGSQATHCDNPAQGTSTALHLETSGSHSYQDSRFGHGLRNAWMHWFWLWYWRHHGDHCAVEPPAQVPEAPQVVMLSTSAAITGGAVLMVLQRRRRQAL